MLTANRSIRVIFSTKILIFTGNRLIRVMFTVNQSIRVMLTFKQQLPLLSNWPLRVSFTTKRQVRFFIKTIDQWPVLAANSSMWNFYRAPLFYSFITNTTKLQQNNDIQGDTETAVQLRFYWAPHSALFLPRCNVSPSS